MQEGNKRLRRSEPLESKKNAERVSWWTSYKCHETAGGNSLLAEIRCSLATNQKKHGVFLLFSWSFCPDIRALREGGSFVWRCSAQNEGRNDVTQSSTFPHFCHKIFVLTIESLGSTGSSKEIGLFEDTLSDGSHRRHTTRAAVVVPTPSSSSGCVCDRKSRSFTGEDEPKILPLTIFVPVGFAWIWQCRGWI